MTFGPLRWTSSPPSLSSTACWSVVVTEFKSAVSLFIQYHNYDLEGLPAGDSYGIHTGLKHVLNATDGQVFLILGIGTPRRYYLWYTFVIEQVEQLDGWDKVAYHAFGPGLPARSRAGRRLF